MKKTIWAIVALIIIIVGISLVAHKSVSTPLQTATSTGATSNLIDTEQYSCNAGKSISANFYSGTDIAGTPTTPPIPGGSAEVKLSDGRNLNLKQTISADGVRYANADESFVFWSKGNGALVLENNVQKSYIGCVKVVADTGGLPNVFSSNSGDFSVRYPAQYTVDANYVHVGNNQGSASGNNSMGVKFTIPASLVKGTNLGSDSFVSVEEVPQVDTCTPLEFLNVTNAQVSLTHEGMTYAVASTSDAGAGNRYEETVYALPGTNPCIAIRYFVHYSVLDNYPAGTVKQYDAATLMAQFDSIRDSLVVNQ